ncbi:LCP family protein [Oceanirhabdus seepicola]|uniref:LCP family protein n=1 Tax=Oceanirhabdus seepicola TaxID=2828781 RepID=A0A9J6P1T4_9CLOT|nr:LCP family protein [Oceanirhabdus seepicola]MCM1990499.1 LCP family protein [Oceanirhabdus seepicola]
MKRAMNLFIVSLLIFCGLAKTIHICGRPVIGDYEKAVDIEKNLESMEKLVHEREKNKKLSNMKIKSEKGITNILLVGVDNRESRRNGRSDAMMILTLDQNKDKMKITSLMRDTYVYIEGHGKEKLNHSYAYGGINLLKKTVENTFKVKMDHYVIVDFQDFEKIVDLLGGVDVYVDEEEIGWIKKRFISENKKMRELGEPGEMMLNGEETLAYSRIRFTSSGSYGRTERHREVLNSIKNKTSKLSFFKYPKLIGTVVNSVTTDMKLGDILDYGYWYSKNLHMDMETLQIPVTEFSEGGIINKEKGWVLQMDIEKNIEVLKKFVFNSK